MRLSKNNIKHVNVHIRNGEIYEVSVAMKSNRVSDVRMYTGEEIKNLPASVKAFTQSHGFAVTSETTIKNDNYTTIKFS